MDEAYDSQQEVTAATVGKALLGLTLLQPGVHGAPHHPTPADAPTA